MARDRRRAKQRRERQSRSASGRAAAEQARAAEPSAAENGTAATPDHEELHAHEPAELVSGDVDLAEVELLRGRPDEPDPDAAGEPLGGSTADELLEHALDVDADDESLVAAPAGGGRRGGDEGTDVARTRERSPDRRGREGNRFVNFLRGSWRELQRVQWPDRRQVAQATAVVIGFVFVAGAFLGLMDFIASRLVNLIV